MSRHRSKRSKSKSGSGEVESVVVVTNETTATPAPTPTKDKHNSPESSTPETTGYLIDKGPIWCQLTRSLEHPSDPSCNVVFVLSRVHFDAKIPDKDLRSDPESSLGMAVYSITQSRQKDDCIRIIGRAQIVSTTDERTPLYPDNQPFKDGCEVEIWYYLNARQGVIKSLTGYHPDVAVTKRTLATKYSQLYLLTRHKTDFVF